MSGRARARSVGRSTELGFGDRLLVGLVSAVGPAVVRLLGATWRVRKVNAGVVDAIRESGRPAVYAFWHCYILPLGYTHRDRGIVVLSSWHRDGEISRRMMEALGFMVERGSTTRGSVRGLIRMVGRAREGRDVAVSPDGPKGPARVAQTGVAFLALKAGGLLLPVAVGADRFRRLSSWDRFMVPSPFARVVVLYGDSIGVADNDDLGAVTAALAVELERLSERAQAIALGDPCDDGRGADTGDRTEGRPGV